MDAQPVQGVQDVDREAHLPADHVLLADRRARVVASSHSLCGEVVADGGVQQAHLLGGGDEAAAGLEGVGLHQVDGELAGLRHPPGRVFQPVGGDSSFATCGTR